MLSDIRVHKILFCGRIRMSNILSSRPTIVSMDNLKRVAVRCLEENRPEIGRCLMNFRILENALDLSEQETAV